MAEHTVSSTAQESYTVLRGKEREGSEEWSSALESLQERLRNEVSGHGERGGGGEGADLAVIGDGDGLGTLRLPIPPLGSRGRAIRQTDTQLHSTPEGRGIHRWARRGSVEFERSAERAGNLERGAGLVWFGLGGVGLGAGQRKGRRSDWGHQDSES
jgi:hypothetical protein